MISQFISSKFSTIITLLLLVVFSTNVKAQAPNISYANNIQTYIKGTAISPLVVTNTGGVVPATNYGQVTRIASNGVEGGIDAYAGMSTWFEPRGLAVDPTGNLYLVDSHNHVVRKITPGGVITTVAGNGSFGNNNGTGTAASFGSPNGLVMDDAGNMYVSDEANNNIRKISNSGVVSTLAGSGSYGSTNGPGTTARFASPNGIALDAAGNVYVADQSNNLIRKINQFGEVSTLAGSGDYGNNNGTGTTASFATPSGLAVDASGNVYVADMGNHLIRKITPAGMVTTFAGSGAYGTDNGIGTAASFSSPSSIAMDTMGNLYVGSISSVLVRRITPAGVVTTIEGSGSWGNTLDMGFGSPDFVAFDQTGNLYLSDRGGNIIRKICITGYTISPALPSGLSFDATTGKISGTPSVLSPATIYTITAYNTSGSSSTTLSIKSLAPGTPPPVAAPAITYANNTQVYNTGTTINPLVIINAGGAVPARIYSQVTTLAGSGIGGSANGTGKAASFKYPNGVAVDASGNAYVADVENNLIRKITAAGVVTTLAGSGQAGFMDGTGTNASFNAPTSVAVDINGNVFVADQGNNMIRKVTPAGVVTTFAGSWGSGYADGTGTAAQFKAPTGVTVDEYGNVYVADKNNNVIRKITAARVVTTLAGGVFVGSSNGTGTAASFNQPTGVAVDALGNVYVADSENHVVRKITPAGVVTTLAGSGVAGETDGPGATASFYKPYGVAVDAAGTVYVADAGRSIMRKISSAGDVSILAGGGQWGSHDGVGSDATFSFTYGVAVDASGYLYVADWTNALIRKISITGYTISPALPSDLIFDGTTGTISGTPIVARPPTNYTVTAYNTGGISTTTLNLTVNSVVVPPPPTVAAPGIAYAGDTQIFIAGTPISSMTPVNTGGTVPAKVYGQVTTFAGSGAEGKVNGTGTAATFSGPWAVDVDRAGNLYVADWFNHLIRKITPAGVVTTLAGSGTAGDANGTGVLASFKEPLGVAVNAVGEVYVSDSGNDKIRRITPSGVVSTFAGNSSQPYGDGTGAAAGFNNPRGLTVDAQGNIYVADEGNKLIRKITPDRVVTTFAGKRFIDDNGVDFKVPSDISIDIAGNFYIVDGSVIRKITPTGVATILAGRPGTVGYVDGPGTEAMFYAPDGIVADLDGNLFVADPGNSVIRKISPAGVVTTLAGSGRYGFADGIGKAAMFSGATGVALDGVGSLVVADLGNHRIRKINLTGYTISSELPAGLSFDVTTGIISGTPTALSAPKTYTITAYNAGGSSSVNITIAVANSKSSGTLPTKNYGDADFTVAGGTGSPTYFSSNPSVATISNNGLVHISGAGNVSLVISNGSNINTQSLTVNKVPLTIKANNQSRTYGADNPELTATYNGFVNGDTPSGFITQPSITTTAIASSTVGSYPITVSGAVSNNYAITYTNASLTINKAPLTIRAVNQSKVYGEDNPGLGLSYSGLVLGQSTMALSSLPTAATTVTKTSAAGNYTILVSGAASDNYAFTYINGTLTVNKAPLTIQADNQSKIYGAVNPILTATYSGFVNGETPTALGTKPTITTTANSMSAAGNYPITASGAAASNYAISYASGTLTVNKAPLTIRADNQTKYQGDPNPVLTASYTGFINGDTKAQLISLPNISTTATTNSPTGTYAITVSGGFSNNYTFSYVGGTLTVGQEAITFNPLPTAVYGGANFNAGASGDGAVNFSSSNTSVATISNGQVRIMGAGTTVITVSDGTHTKTQILTVDKAPLTISADSKNKIYGSTNPALTATYTGFVNGDTPAQLTTVATLATTATVTSSTGSYPVTVSGAASNNYVISYAPGILTVNKAPLTITADDLSKTYGSANPPLTATYNGFVNGDTKDQLLSQPVLSTTATATSPTGTYPVTVSGAISNNYSIAYVNALLTVEKANLTITAENQSKMYGELNPVLTASYTGFVNGETAAALISQPTFTTTATTTSVSGTYPITAIGAASNNYLISYVPGVLTVMQPPPPTIASISPSTAAAGTSVTVTGTNLLGTTAVSFGGMPASSFVVNSSTSISAVVAAGSSNGLSVTTNTGTVNFSGLSFVPVPTIAAGGPTTILTGGKVVLAANAPGGVYSYQWLKDGNAIEAATASNYTATQDGVYSVKITLNSVSQVSNGVPVKAVFALPEGNFRLVITGATCKGTNNGSVNISATQASNYTATITGDNSTATFPFSSAQTISNLAAGTYNICITVAGQPDYQQCFKVIVTEPKDLSVFSTVNTDLNTVNLLLNGSNHYNINLNGTTYTTTEHTISLPLIAGINKLTVTADQLCQGTVEQTINNTGIILPYPNPFEDVVNLNLGLSNIKDVMVQINKVSNGSLVFRKQYTNQLGILKVDVSSLKSGIYALKLTLNGSANIFKIIKK